MKFEFDVAFTIITTLCIVPLLSYIVSKFKTLPVDITVASISIIVLFPQEIDKFSLQHATEMTKHSAALTMLIVIIIIALSALSLIQFSIFLNGRDNLSLEKKSGIFIEAKKNNKDLLWYEIAYCFSLFISLILLFTSFTIINSISIIYIDKNNNSEDIFNIVRSINSAYNSEKTLGIVCLIYLFLLLVGVVSPKPRNFPFLIKSMC
jgi:hypothetical protein